MATIQKYYESDELSENVGINLQKRTVSDGATPPVFSGEYYGTVLVTFDGGRKAINREVKLSELSKADRDALITGALAMHAIAVGKVSAKDF